MKNIYKKQLFIVIVLFVVSPLSAQTSRSSEKKNEPVKKENSIVKDLDANGIDDSKESQRSGKKQGIRMRDQFIDINGDGICDNREQGFGFRRGKGQSTNQSGKRQQGRQK